LLQNIEEVKILFEDEVAAKVCGDEVIGEL
jgi:hypothetical protein